MADEGLHVKCIMCGEPLDKPGALVFGPPNVGVIEDPYGWMEKNPDADVCRKFHVCVGCWPTLFELLIKRLCKGS
jgi:hypothetical protein